MYIVKKTIPIFIMIFLVLSIAVNAAWLESFYGQTVISGAPTANDQYLSASFSEIIGPSEIKIINHNLEKELNGIIVKSTYNPSAKNAQIELSKSMQIRDYQRVRFDDGIWTARIETDKLTFFRGDPNKKVETQTPSVITGAAVVDNNIKLVLVTGNANYIEFPYNKIVSLPHNFIAVAKNADTVVTITVSKTLIVNDKEKIPGTNIVVSVDSESIKLSTVAAQNIPAAKKISLKDRIFGYFMRALKKDSFN